MNIKLNKNLDDYKNKQELFDKFYKSVECNNEMNFDIHSINNIINEAVEKAINDIVIKTINTKAILTSSRNVGEVAKNCEKFFQDSNFGKFEYMQKSGRSNFKVIHELGDNGNKFLRKFFEKIFKTCLKNYSYHMISNQNSLCVIFR
ncbi:hypothetical protein C6990_05125 [Nitrosopumilus sp. b3]|uniref:hypothetical protein n=1 Tax=Nitrosopumilus sp. b3 TaxID=2109909 RepID=UPI0015F5EA34|nr:hypothetical protein [Nitrosopumilus sp. b3]KAF6247066.1 hypothetical protein C6990_05125 [Nitrosopumilus sp. b3]